HFNHVIKRLYKWLVLFDARMYRLAMTGYEINRTDYSGRSQTEAAMCTRPSGAGYPLISLIQALSEGGHVDGWKSAISLSADVGRENGDSGYLTDDADCQWKPGIPQQGPVASAEIVVV